MEQTQTQAIYKPNEDIISKLVLEGDLSKMTSKEKTQYYKSFCESLGLNPLTQPFQLIKFQGKERMYATKDCTEQLRKIHGVSITDVTAQELRGVYVVTAKALDISGKTDAATGVVNIENLKGDNLANALMKAETKAKRRVTLSICGLGILDESETETIPGAVKTTIEEPKQEKLKVEITEEYAQLKDMYCDLLTDDTIFSKQEQEKYSYKPHWTLANLQAAFKTMKERKEDRLRQLELENQE